MNKTNVQQTDNDLWPVGALPQVAMQKAAADQKSLLCSRESSGHNVLVVDDDPALGKFLSRELMLKSFAVRVQRSGEAACQEFIRQSCDLVILEVDLPGMDGIEVMRQMRLSDPSLLVMVLTARRRIEDLVQVLEMGADDYLMKPFSFLELHARINSLLRRRASLIPDVSRVGDLILHPGKRHVSRNGRRIDLTPREYSILTCLMDNLGKPVSRATLMRDVWHVSFDPSTNIVDVYMKYLRDKINDAGETKLIRTIRGVGYVLSAD
jgi:two-component system copper resistance phosphate regulon response regulator CusR